MITSSQKAEGTVKHVQTDYAEFTKYDSGILKINFNVKFDETIELFIAQSYVSIVVQFAKGNRQPVLLNFLNFSNLPSVKIINFLAKSKDLQKVSGPKAVVLNSYIVRMIFTQYMKIVGDDQPFKIFKTEEDANSWLKIHL